MSWMVPALVLAALVVGCKKKNAALTRDTVAALKAADAKTGEMQGRWDVAFAGVDGVVPRRDLGGCSYMPLSDGVDRVRNPTTLRTMAAPRVATVMSDIAVLRANARSSAVGVTRKGLDDARYLASAEAWAWDWVIVVDEQEAARTAPGGVFMAGHARGRAYAFDYRDGAIKCAGSWAARNSDQVRYVDDGSGRAATAGRAIDDDLRASIRGSALQSLVAAGPPPAQP